MIAAVDPWRFHAHPEVWLLIAGIIGLALYATRVIGPKVVRDGSPIVTGRQKFWFVFGVVMLWVAADWPVHDIGEHYLYSVHMAQHLLLTMVVPPLFLLATPTWLARSDRRRRLVRRAHRAAAVPSRTCGRAVQRCVRVRALAGDGERVGAAPLRCTSHCTC